MPQEQRMCYHPELLPTRWEQKKPEPCLMIIHGRGASPGLQAGEDVNYEMRPPEVFALGSMAVLGAEAVRRSRPTTPAMGLVASIAIGLESGFGATETFDPNTIRKEVMKRFPKGGTLVVQYGGFETMPESSVRISIENMGTGMSDQEFMEKIEQMIREFVRDFRQKSIWLDYYRGSERLEAISFDWKD